MSNGRRLRTAVRFSVLLITCLFYMASGAVAGQSDAPSTPDEAQDATKVLAITAPEGFHEDADSLALGTSSMLPSAAAVGEKADVPDNKFIREHILLNWRPVDIINLYVAIPKGVKKPPVILYLYSYPESANRFKIDSWSAATSNTAYASVGFVSALTADRIPDTRPAKGWFVSELHESLVTTVHDVQMILNYLASRGDLDMDHVGMFGVGSGGAIAILASAVDPRIKAIDVFTPWGDWPDWLAKSSTVPQDQRAKFLTPEFLAGVAPFDPLNWLPKVKAQAVRIQAVRSESTVPVQIQEKLEAAAPDNSEIIQFGDYNALASAEPGSSVFGWLQMVLNPDSPYKPDPDKAKRTKIYPAKGKKFDPSDTHP